MHGLDHIHLADLDVDLLDHELGNHGHNPTGGISLQDSVAHGAHQAMIASSKDQGDPLLIKQAAELVGLRHVQRVVPRTGSTENRK